MTAIRTERPTRAEFVGALALATIVLAAGPIGPAGLAAIAVLSAAALVRLARALRSRGGRHGGRLRSGASVLEGAAALIAVVAAVSYARAMLQPSNSSLPIRTVEWLRDNGGAGLVSEVESAYYSLTAPAKGGPQLRTLVLPGEPPSAAAATPVPLPPAATPASTAIATATAAPRRPRPYRPPRVMPVIDPALPGEGTWRPTAAAYVRSGEPPVLVTAYRPDPSYPRVVAGLAWFDHRSTAVELYPGLQEPPAGGGARLADVPASARGALLATFNGGFKHRDGLGGFFAGERLYEPLVRGQGTLIGWRGGRVDVRAWTGGPRPAGDVLFARQNLPLIVDRVRPNPSLGDGPQWGATVHSAVLVWRSGAGVDARGNLIYAAGPDLSAPELARILIHAGAVRAIELDINSYWVTLNTYGAPGARDPRSLLPTMNRPAQRYLSPDDRDFFAVYAR